jgi:basic membrane protein A and related proteins
MRARTLLIAVLVVAVALLAGCGGGNDENAATPPTTTAPETTDGATGKPIKVGLVTDIGGLDDRSFNFLANQGLERAEEQLGVDGRVLISKSESDYVPNLSSLARQDYELVIGVGFLMANAVEKVAKRFPDTSFAIIDFSQADMKSKPANVRGLLFKEQEAGYLAGYLAGLVTAEEAGSRQVISSVGGQKIPPVDRYIAGFRAGARRADAKLRTLKAYSQDFIDQAKCKEAALDQIAQGSRVVFQVAGNCGLGALSAAKEKNVWGIGVDADQSYLGDFILTSAVKKVDNAVFQTIQDEQEGSFSGGEDVVFDVASGGVGLGKISPQVTADIVSKVQSAQDDIAAGKITDIPTSVK